MRSAKAPGLAYEETPAGAPAEHCGIRSRRERSRRDASCQAPAIALGIHAEPVLLGLVAMHLRAVTLCFPARRRRISLPRWRLARKPETNTFFFPARPASARRSIEFDRDRLAGTLQHHQFSVATPDLATAVVALGPRHQALLSPPSTASLADSLLRLRCQLSERQLEPLADRRSQSRNTIC
ncbi:hypothetical protein L1887_61047 [Cichorium endivia]|nr:hypothetical protein L1887_61047 [Cichorium endivia]